jgi:hypothetical protein
MIGFICSVKKSRTDADGNVFLEVQVSPQYRMKAAAVAAMVKESLVAQFALEVSRQLPRPPEDGFEGDGA